LSVRAVFSLVRQSAQQRAGDPHAGRHAVKGLGVFCLHLVAQDGVAALTGLEKAQALLDERVGEDHPLYFGLAFLDGVQAFLLDRVSQGI